MKLSMMVTMTSLPPLRAFIRPGIAPHKAPAAAPAARARPSPHGNASGGPANPTQAMANPPTTI